ncbi:MAG TPA: S-adenosylmethionine decarboxylase [Thermoanaerobaculia bacterium]|jgi:S-adenosylmethionine decarboxylase
MNIGFEWLVEASGCRVEALRSVETLRAVFERVIAELELKQIAAPAWHVFPDPGGVTGFVMLTESHLSCHTYPEHGVAAINLYCCRPRGDWPWDERLREMLGASAVRVRAIDRAGGAESSE